MFAPYSILEDCQIEFVQSRGIGNDVDFDDFPAPDLEAENPRHSPAWSPHESHRSVNQHRLYGAGKLREAERPLGPSLRATDLPRCSRAPSEAHGRGASVSNIAGAPRQRVPVGRAANGGCNEKSAREH